MNSQCLLIGLSLWVFVPFLTAQNCDLTFSGKVLDFHDGTSLDQSSVTLIKTNENMDEPEQVYKIITNQQGVFKFNHLCEGQYELTILHDDCAPITDSFFLDTNSNQTYFLEHHALELEHIDLEGNPKETPTGVEQSVSVLEMESHQLSDVGSALKTLSGVDALSTGSSITKPILHGLYGNRIVVLNNGVRQESHDWGLEHAPSMDINAFNELKVIKGGGAIKYGGDAIAGVILAEPSPIKKGNHSEGKVSTSFATNGWGGGLNAQYAMGISEKWGIRVQGSSRILGDREAPDYVLSNTGDRQLGGSFELGMSDLYRNISFYYSYVQNEVGILRAAHIGTPFDLLQSINNRQPSVIRGFTYDILAPKQEVAHHLAKINASQRFHKFGELTAEYHFQLNQRKEFDVRRGEDLSRAAMDVDLTTHQFRLDATYDYLKDVHINAGLYASFQNNFTNPNVTAKRLIPDYDQWKYAAYISADYHLERWYFETAFRWDYHRINAKKFYDKDDWISYGYAGTFDDWIIGDFDSQWLVDADLEFNTLSFFAGINYRLHYRHSFHLNYNLSNRPPNVAELFSDGLHHSAATYELGDFQLEAETGHKFLFNYEAMNLWNNLLTSNFTVYYQWINDFINQTPTATETIRGSTFPVWEFGAVDATLWGLDWDLDLQLNDQWKFTNSASYVHGEDETFNQPLIHIPPLRLVQEITFQQKKWNDFYIAFSHEYTTRQNRYPNFNFPVSFIENGQIITETLDISKPPEQFSLFHLKTGMNFKWKEDDLSIQLIAQNLLNQQYRNYLNRLRFFADEIGFNLMFNLTYKF